MIKLIGNSEKSDLEENKEKKERSFIDKVYLGLFCFSIIAALLSVGYIIVITIILPISIQNYFLTPFLLALIGGFLGWISFLFREIEIEKVKNRIPTKTLNILEFILGFSGFILPVISIIIIGTMEYDFW